MGQGVKCQCSSKVGEGTRRLGGGTLKEPVSERMLERQRSFSSLLVQL